MIENKTIGVKYAPKIEYCGQVTVSLVDCSGRVIRMSKHNAGESALFRYFADCLCGHSVISSYPRKIDIRLNGTSQSIITARDGISVRDSHVENIGGWCAVLGFAVNNIDISQPETSVDLVLLGGTNANEDFAKVENIPESIINQLVPGTTLYIEWTLAVQNIKNSTEA